MSTLEEVESRTETGQVFNAVRRPAKSHQDYWRQRVKQRCYKAGDGELRQIPELQVRMFFLRREAWFNLETVNQSAAAAKARDIYLSLVSKGWEATLAKYKPSPVSGLDVCTVGQFLSEVAMRSHLKPKTFARYAVKMRKMVSDISNLEEGLKSKEKRAKYDYATGGRNAWLARIDSQRIDVLSPSSVQNWRNGYIAKSGHDHVVRKSAERSAASYIRCVRALFTSDIVSALRVKLPANPFNGVKLRDPGPQRYHSDINPQWLLACATRELASAKPQEFLAFILCFWAGLRRKEADLLTWEQVDFGAGGIHVRRTAHFEPKTEDSQRVVDVPAAAMDVLQRFKTDNGGVFVLAGADPRNSSTYDYYRCDATWRRLIEWLRSKGVTDLKAIHSLRKESGSLIASAFGIEAARQHLGHRDIRTTSSHYVDKKRRIEVTFPLQGPDCDKMTV